jgi:hypothetical protein
MGMSPDEVALEYPHLTPAHVHAALAYYHANREEIEADIAQEDAAGAQCERSRCSSNGGVNTATTPS